jgi:hypothetical protein
MTARIGPPTNSESIIIKDTDEPLTAVIAPSTRPSPLSAVDHETDVV